MAPEPISTGGSDEEFGPKKPANAQALKKRARSADVQQTIADLQPAEREFYDALDIIQAKLAEPGRQVNSRALQLIKALSAQIDKLIKQQEK